MAQSRIQIRSRSQHKTLLLTILIILVLILSPSISTSNQKILAFDDDDNDDELPLSQSAHNDPQPPANKEHPSVPSAPVPSPSGLIAMAIQRVTGWNDTVVAKLTGQITPRAPHPFVVPITDENYDQVIESELDLLKPGWGSSEHTIWVISVVATDRVSSLFEDVFDQVASNSSLATAPPPPKKREDEVTILQKDKDDPYLFEPNIRFGRIDYMGQTDLLLTKWLIFKCPFLVVITNKGKELRFFKTGAVPPPPDHLGDFLREQRWKHKPVWNSTFSAGNSGEWVVVGMGKMFQGFHLLTDKVPGWLLMIISSMLGTSLMQWLHASQAKEQLNRNPKPGSAPAKTLKEELAEAAVGLAEAKAKQSARSDDERGESSGIEKGSGSGTPKKRRKAGY